MFDLRQAADRPAARKEHRVPRSTALLRRRALTGVALASVLLVGMATARAVAPATSLTFEEHVEPFLEEHCFACHGPEKQKARVRFDRVEGFRVEDRHLWTAVHEKLSAGEMPPESRPQPAGSEKRKVLSWIEEEQRALLEGSTRRLNRRELSAALQDLTGLSVDFAAALPGDGKVAGFDTGAEALQDSAESVARLLEVTRRAVDGIRFLEGAPGRTLTADLREAEKPRKAFDHWKEEDGTVKVRGIEEPGQGLLLEPKWLGERGGLNFHVTPPANGEGILRLKLSVSAVKGGFEGIPNPHLWVEVGGDAVDYREITAPPGKPHALLYEVQLDDLAIEASMREETIAYIGKLIAENRPARELIVSDWTMMNDSLAVHYGYDGVQGGHLRRVRLRDDDPRGGGILGHAGIQSMLCWMGENWVIYRGAWALRHILDDPPPPPPLEVPELIPSDGENRGKTFRELLARHQEDDKCSVCHESIDPLGFAFQNFDLSGRWREVEYEHYVRNELDGKIEWRGAGKTRPVDAAGRLPRGEEFASYAECKQLIVAHYLKDLVGGLMKNLVIYGTGRKPEVADMTEIRAIMEEQEPRRYPLRDLLKAFVRSRIFLES